MSESGEGNPHESIVRNVDYRDYKFIGGKVDAIDQRVGAHGFVGAINSFFEERGIHINPVMSDSTREVLLTRPTVIIATHPDLGADPLAIIGAIPTERKDVSVLAGEWADRLGENVSEHIIPVYGTAEQPTNNNGIKLLRKVLKAPLKLSNIPTGELGRQHVMSIATAKDRVNAGGIIVIFPEGPGGRDSEWKNGVGDIVIRSSNPDLNVVFARTKPGEAWRNRGRLAKSITSKVLGSTTINVDFSDPHNVAEYLGNRKHNVTQLLKGQYEEFVISIEANK